MDNIKKLKKEIGRVCSHFACRNDCSREESCIAIERDLKMWIDENLKPSDNSSSKKYCYEIGCRFRDSPYYECLKVNCELRKSSPS